MAQEDGLVPGSLEVLRAMNVIRGSDEPSGLKTEDALKIAVVMAADRIRDLQAQIESHRKAFEAEIAANSTLRNEFGAHKNETLGGFVARLAAGQRELQERRAETNELLVLRKAVVDVLGANHRGRSTEHLANALREVKEAPADVCGVMAHGAFARDVAEAMGLPEDHDMSLGDLAEMLKTNMRGPPETAPSWAKAIFDEMKRLPLYMQRMEIPDVIRSLVNTHQQYPKDAEELMERRQESGLFTRFCLDLQGALGKAQEPALTTNQIVDAVSELASRGAGVGKLSSNEEVLNLQAITGYDIYLKSVYPAVKVSFVGWLADWVLSQQKDRENLRSLAQESYLKRKELWWALKQMTEDLGAQAILGRIDKALTLLDTEKAAHEKEDGGF